jgi:hypothetical protein
MRDALSDLLKQTSALFPQALVEGTDSETKVSAMTADKTIIFKAILKQPLADLKGESALSNLSMLGGLLNFSSYNTDTATFTVTRSARHDGVEDFRFKDSKKAGSVYRLMNPAMIKEEDRPPSVANIPWEMSFEPQKAKLTEFSQLAGLYSEVDKLFTPRTVDGDLRFIIGDEGSSNHRCDMVFEEAVTANIKGDIKYSIPAFQSIIKAAGGHPATLHLTSRGVMMVRVETTYGVYEYILRATR